MSKKNPPEGITADDYVVCYSWDTDGVVKHGHTVVPATSLAEAKSSLKRRHPHITITERTP